jgi:type II secretory pathway component PulC
MKYFLALMLIFFVLGVIPGRADDVLPPRFNFDRYSAMVKKSPFAIATAVAVSATPDFAKDLYVANAARSREGDMVTIASSSDQNFKKYLNTNEPVDGYGIASIEWSEKVGATKVTISKDGRFATLTFNQTLLAQQAPPPNAPPAPRQMPPSPDLRQAPQAHVRGVIQRNPTAVAVPTPNLKPPQGITPQQPQYRRGRNASRPSP